MIKLTKRLSKQLLTAVLISSLAAGLSVTPRGVMTASAASSGKDDAVGQISGNEMTQTIENNSSGKSSSSSSSTSSNNSSSSSDNKPAEKTVITYNINNSPNISVREISSTAESVKIPDTVRGSDDKTYFVTSIKSDAFSNSRSVKDLEIGNNVETIGSNAFSSSNGLGSRVRTIGAGAFQNCVRLNSVTFGDSVETIGKHAFANDESLTSVSLGNRVTSIGPGAFVNNYSLSTVTMGDSISNIDRNAFRNDISLKSISLPESLTRLSSGVFYGDTHLTSVTFGNRISVIGEKAFTDTAITDLVIPDSVTEIRENTFRRCRYLTSLTLGGNVRTIDANAFRGDQFLTTVTVNTTSLSGVGQKAFGGISHSAEFSITAPKPVFKAEVALIKASTLPKGVTFTRVKVNN